MATAAERKKLFGHAENNYLNCSKGFRSWAFTLDHKRIGVMYLIGVTFALLLAGVFALVLRTNLWTNTSELLSDKMYNQMFTLHGAVMVFAFIIPSIPAALGNFVLPMMLGGQGCGVSPFEPVQFLSVGHWDRVFVVGHSLGQGAGHRLDVLHTVFDPDRYRGHLRNIRRVCAWIQLDLYRA